MRHVVRQQVFDVRVRVAHAGLASAPVIALGLIHPYGTTPEGIALLSVILAWFLIFAIRGARSATVILSDSRLTVRTWVYTKSWPAAQVEAFVAETRLARPGFGQLGPGPLSIGLLMFVQRPRRMLGIRFRGGATMWLAEFKSRPAANGERTWVDAQADILNNALDREDRTTEPAA